MAIAPRPKNKARKIFYNILGKPENLAYKPTKRKKDINRKIDIEDAQRVR